MSTKTQKIKNKVKKMAKKAETPKTDKDALKASLLKEVNEKKEKERLERVEENKQIQEVTVFTKENDPISTQLIKMFKEDGVAYIEKPIEKFKEEKDKVILMTNQNQWPMVVTHTGEYLVNNRDFKQPAQVVHILRRIGTKDIEMPPNDIRILEGFKNMAAGIALQLSNTQRQIQGLQQTLTPIKQFIDKLKEEVETEDKEDAKKNK